MDEQSIRSLTGNGWRAEGAYVDRLDQVPGPGGSPLHRIGNKLHAYAWFECREALTIPPGERASVAITVAKVTALSSALVLASAIGRPEVRVDWTVTPPRVRVLWQTGGVRAVEGRLKPSGHDCWRLHLLAENTMTHPIDVRPTFYVARGVENSGLDLGLHAGDISLDGVKCLDAPGVECPPSARIDRPVLPAPTGAGSSTIAYETGAPT